MPGDFSKPTNVAVDKDGNLYVTDTLNDRVEVFDADGNFIRAFGKNGDGPGDFARPKGIAVDSDGHVWVADAMLNRLQVFTPEGRCFSPWADSELTRRTLEALAGLTIDNKNNRVFTSEQILGRVQMFRYYTNAEAKAALERKQTELAKKAQGRDKKTDASPQPAATPAPAEAPVKNGMKLPEPPAAAPQAPADAPVRNGMKLPEPPAGTQTAPAK